MTSGRPRRDAEPNPSAEPEGPGESTTGKSLVRVSSGIVAGAVLAVALAAVTYIVGYENGTRRIVFVPWSEGAPLFGAAAAWALAVGADVALSDDRRQVDREGTIGFRASGRVTRDDYRDALMPPMREAAEAGEVRLLFVIGPEFEKMEAGARARGREALGCRVGPCAPR